MKNTIDIYPENAIKSFLRIETPKLKDSPYYEVNIYQNIITLHNPFEKKFTDRSSNFELDKIFTNENENSFIFEEICLNTTKDCLDGFSYSFISYGETSSKKVDVLIGNIEDSVTNINNRGIYPRLLESLLKKVKKNENKYNLSMSFFMIYGNILVDLSVLKDIDKNNITRNNLFDKSFTIKNETDIIKNISKIKVDKLEDNLKYINKILSSLYKIEKSTKEHLFSNSHICLVLHLNDKNENLSNISFILLNGSEYLFTGESKKFGLKEHNINAKNKIVVDGAKMTLETQFTFETVFNCIKSVKCLNAQDEKNDKDNKKENLLFSNLTTVLYNLCFGDNIKKIKFRIIGTIYPNTGFYTSVKDTVLFLYECRNIMKRKRNKMLAFDNVYETTSDIMEKKKDDYIFQLENKVKNQKKRIDELNKNMVQKESTINLLRNTYLEQINVVKKKLNFPGDISVLISGDENTKEANFVREMREYQDCIKRNEGNIHILEKKLKQANDEIVKLKNKTIVKNSDETMVNYYISVRHEEENRNKDDKHLKVLYNQIDVLKKEVKEKDQINIELKKEIQKKNDILFNLPLGLKDNYTINQQFGNNINITKTKENATKSNKDTELKSDKQNNDKESENNNNENNNSESESLDNDAYYGEKIRKIKEDNKNSIFNIKSKYESILEDKNKEFNNIKLNIEKIHENYKNEISLWKNELIKYNEKYMQLISNYKRIFFSRFAPQYNIVTLKNKKEEFDNVLIQAEKEINYLNFPKLFNELELKNKLGITITGSIVNMRKTMKKKMEKIEKKIISKENDKKSDESLQNLKLGMPPVPYQQIKNTVDEALSNKKKLIINKESLESMSKEAVILHCLNLNKKVEEIENYLEKYAQYKKGFNIEAFENNINYKEKNISELNETINKLRNNLDEQVQINYNNMNVINTQNRIIEKFQKEKFLGGILCKNKNYNGSIFSNIYMNENSTYSTLVHSFHRNNNNLALGGYKMKKSNSCYDINLIDNKEQLKSERNDYNNQYISSVKLPNEPLMKSNTDKNRALNRKMRPFSTRRQLKKKEFN